MDDKVSIRECDMRYKNVVLMMDKLEERIEKLENKFWWIITLLVGNLVGVITLLIKETVK